MAGTPDTRDRDGRRRVVASDERIRELQTALQRATQLANAHANVIERSLHAVADKASLESLCGQLLRTIVTELEADSGAFWLCDDDNELVARIYLAFEEGRVVRGEDSSHPGREPRPIPEELASHWRQHRYDPVVYQQEDFLESASLEFCRDYYRDNEVRTVVTIPLVLGEQLFGTCAVRWKRQRLLDVDDLRLATALSMQAALALQLVRFAQRAREAALAEERERAAQERAAALGVLNEALKAEVAERLRAEQMARGQAAIILRSLDSIREQPSVDAFVEEVLKTIVEQLGGMGASLWTPEEEDGYGRVVLDFDQRGFLRGDDIKHPGRLKRANVHLQTKLWDTEDPQPIVMDAAFIDNDPSYEDFRAWARRLGIRTVLVLPLIYRSRLTGVLAIRFGHDHAFSSDELRFTRMLSLHATLAQQLALLGNEARETAVMREREAAAHRQASELSHANQMLQDALYLLTSEPELDAFLAFVLRSVVGRFRAHSCSLQMQNAEGTRIWFQLTWEGGRLHAAEEYGESPLGRAYEESSGFALRRAVFDTPEPHFVTDIDNGPTLTPALRDALHAIGVRSLANVPLLIGLRVIGRMIIRFDTVRQVGPDDLQLMQSIANQMALAMHMARLGSEARETAVLREREGAADRRAEDLSRANRILQDALHVLTSEPELDAFLAFVLRSVVERFHAHSSSLLVLDAAGKGCFLQNWDGGRFYSAQEYANSPLVQAYERSAGVPGVRASFHTLEPHVVTDIEDGGPSITPELREALRGMGVRSIANLPMLIDSRVMGRLIIRFDVAGPMGADNLQVMQSIANQMALAMHMARLGSEARETAVLREREEAADRRAADLSHANRILQEALHLLTSEPELNAFVSFVLRSVVERFGAHSSSLQVLYAGGTRILFLQNWEGGRLHSAEEYASSPLVQAYERSVNVATVRDTYERPEARVFNVEAGPPWTPELWEALRNMGVRTIANLPLMIGSRVIGRLVIRFDTVRQVGADDLQLMQSIANQVALAMHLTRLAVEGNRTAVLGERTRMARDIHDTLAQGFTGVIIQLEAAKDANSLQRAADADAHIERAVSLARLSLAEARRSVHALRPLALEHGSLSAALETMLENMTVGTGIRGHARTEGDAFAIALDWEEHLLRIGQEALSNALKHGTPRSINVLLRFSPTEIVLEVQDDGVGFDPNRQSDGMGLTGMQERCARMGGHFELDTAPGRGVRLRVTVALDLGSGSGVLARK